ncbi:MAG: DUF3185 family protein [Verrucomicrobiales bacterium]
MRQNQLISLVLLVVGVVLIGFGLNASDSFSSDISRVFTGGPTDRATWMLIGGSVLALVGLVGMFRSGGSRSRG